MEDWKLMQRLSFDISCSHTFNSFVCRGSLQWFCGHEISGLLLKSNHVFSVVVVVYFRRNDSHRWARVLVSKYRTIFKSINSIYFIKIPRYQRDKCHIKWLFMACLHIFSALLIPFFFLFAHVFRPFQSVNVNYKSAIRHNDEFRLTCDAFGSPHMTFRWYKNGIYVNQTKATRYVQHAKQKINLSFSFHSTFNRSGSEMVQKMCGNNFFE